MRPDRVWRCFALVLTTLASAPLTASGAGAAPGLFETHEPLTIALEAPFRKIAADSVDAPPYHDALLRMDGTEIPLRIRARGKHRRNPKVCQFPPLRLNFDKDTVGNTVFAGQDKLKLVTHCQRVLAFQQYVLREYLAYRLYNHITDYSFRVRLVNVTYIDPAAGGRELTRIAFLIENRHQMAKRNDAEAAKVEFVKRHQLDPEATNLYELFQYLIGNPDWSNLYGPEGERCCHNTELITSQPGRYIPVPFDFDSTGIVNPPYAKPSEELPIDFITERIYRGFCRPDEVVTASLERFRAQREAMLATIEEQPGLGRWTAGGMTRYVKSFFAIMDDARRRERAIEGHCR